MKFERQWNDKDGLKQGFVEITEDRANRELANQHGDNAVKKLQAEKELKTRFATYRVVD